MKTLERITVYPIKSLDGISLDKVEITPGGSLSFDREFALIDEDGKFINGKKFGQIHLIRSVYCLTERLVEFSIGKDNFKKVFHLEKEKTEIEYFFSDFLGKKIIFRQNRENGFPDDLSASGPTVVSSASLEEVAKWFPDISVEELYRRFRPNLLITNTPAFWEDNLFGEKGEEKHFQIGVVRFVGVNPCARCAVPTKNPVTGEAISSFQKHFAGMRKNTLPKWSNLSQFDHFYRFCVNTKIPVTEAGKYLSAGNAVSLEPQY
ncbi:MAG: MOSC N-terminal beta barrel domain-containing protein [Ignavibacteria bacterium]|nr:MOSC N-terminal beta barrel domain-containing protein [Ignavibacteria bacterium]